MIGRPRVSPLFPYAPLFRSLRPLAAAGGPESPERPPGPAPASPMTELVDEVPAAAVAISAHPDDPEVSCGGTLARWAAAGSDVHMVICARGDKGSADPAADRDALAARRRDEVAASAAALGLAGWEILPHDDGDLEDTRQFREELVTIVRRGRAPAGGSPRPTARPFGPHDFSPHAHPDRGFCPPPPRPPRGAPPRT